MNKHELNKKTEATVIEIRTALKTVYDALNQGQQKKILKVETVAKLFEKYGVEINV